MQEYLSNEAYRGVMDCIEKGDKINRRLAEQVAVGMKAIEQGVARENHSREELTKRAEKMIHDSRDTVALLMREGYIPPAPVEPLSFD